MYNIYVCVGGWVGGFVCLTHTHIYIYIYIYKLNTFEWIRHLQTL